MSKVLRVIDPFFVMEIGDTFELSEDGKEYVCTNQIETDEDIKRALAIVANFVNKILGE